MDAKIEKGIFGQSLYVKDVLLFFFLCPNTLLSVTNITNKRLIITFRAVYARFAAAVINTVSRLYN
jgi:hypothetical protein